MIISALQLNKEYGNIMELFDNLLFRPDNLIFKSFLKYLTKQGMIDCNSNINYNTISLFSKSNMNYSTMLSYYQYLEGIGKETIESFISNSRGIFNISEKLNCSNEIIASYAFILGNIMLGQKKYKIDGYNNMAVMCPGFNPNNILHATDECLFLNYKNVQPNETTEESIKNMRELGYTDPLVKFKCINGYWFPLIIGKIILDYYEQPTNDKEKWCSLYGLNKNLMDKYLVIYFEIYNSLVTKNVKITPTNEIIHIILM